MQILRSLLTRRLFSRYIYLRGTLALLASFLLLGVPAAFTPAYAASTAKMPTAAWHTFHDPVYGFSLTYPGTWALTTERNGSHITLLNPATRTTISPIVSTQAGTSAAALKHALPAQSVDRQTLTVAGHQTIGYLLPYVSAPRTQSPDAVEMGGPQQSRLVIIPVTNTTGTTNIYTFLLTQPTNAMGKISVAEQADQRTFEAILNSFVLPVKVVSPYVASATTNATGCDRICWADNNWMYGYYDDSYTVAEYQAQPNFQCAEFVARALTQDEMVPGLNNGGVNGNYSPASNQNSYEFYGSNSYDLLDVGVTGLLGLHDYLINSGLATNIGQNTSQAQPGDVLFFYDNGRAAGYTHTMIITSIGSDGTIYLDGHNVAEYHEPLADPNFDIYHFPVARSSSYHHMSGFSQFGTSRYQLHSDGSIYKYLGTPLTGWQMLDNNVKAVAIATDGTGNLYQLHNDGSIYKYLGTPLTGWQMLDNNVKAIAIAADGTGHLYQLHSDGSIYIYLGTPLTGWQMLDNNVKAVAIAADGTGHLYQLHNDGSIYIYLGTPLTGWQMLDNNVKATAIAVDNVGDLYQLHNDGSIYKYLGTPLTGWQMLDNNVKATAIAADGTGDLYQLHSDGSIYKYLGTPLTGWQMLDNNVKAIALSGAY